MAFHNGFAQKLFRSFKRFGSNVISDLFMTTFSETDLVNNKRKSNTKVRNMQIIHELHEDHYDTRIEYCKTMTNGVNIIWDPLFLEINLTDNL